MVTSCQTNLSHESNFPVSIGANFLPTGFTSSNSPLNARYQIQGLIGQGKLGKTFLAIDLDSDQSPCIINQLFLDESNFDLRQNAIDRCHQKAQHLAELGKHPQIPQLLNCFEQAGYFYLVQEWIDGQNLEQELTETGAFNEAEIWQFLGEMLPILQFIHDRQIVHCDIKPANIIRCRLPALPSCAAPEQRRDLILVDFGAANYLDLESSLDAKTQVGSAEYAALEQIRGQAVFASDLYSLGMTCLHLLTQMPPFDLHDMGEGVEEWQPYLATPISPSLQKILCKLLQSPLRRRYRSAAQVLLDLQARDVQTGSMIQTVKSLESLPIADEAASRQSLVINSLRPALISAINAARTAGSVTSATIYNPQTRTWYDFAPETETWGRNHPVSAGKSKPFNLNVLPVGNPKNRFYCLQKLRLRSINLLAAQTKDAIDLVFSALFLLSLTSIGSMLLICFFFEMERRSPLAPQPEIQQSQHHHAANSL